MGMLLALAAGLGGISTEDLRREFAVESYDVAIVNDAIGRFAIYNGTTEEIAMKYAVPIVIPFPDKRCVFFWIHGLSLGGGTAIYCYEVKSNTIIESFESGDQ